MSKLLKVILVVLPLSSYGFEIGGEFRFNEYSSEVFKYTSICRDTFKYSHHTFSFVDFAINPVVNFDGTEINARFFWFNFAHDTRKLLDFVVNTEQIREITSYLDALSFGFYSNLDNVEPKLTGIELGLASYSLDIGIAELDLLTKINYEFSTKALGIGFDIVQIFSPPRYGYSFFTVAPTLVLTHDTLHTGLGFGFKTSASRYIKSTNRIFFEMHGTKFTSVTFSMELLFLQKGWQVEPRFLTFVNSNRNIFGGKFFMYKRFGGRTEPSVIIIRERVPVPVEPKSTTKPSPTRRVVRRTRPRVHKVDKFTKDLKAFNKLKSQCEKEPTIENLIDLMEKLESLREKYPDKKEVNDLLDVFADERIKIADSLLTIGLKAFTEKEDFEKSLQVSEKILKLLGEDAKLVPSSHARFERAKYLAKNAEDCYERSKANLEKLKESKSKGAQK